VTEVWVVEIHHGHGEGAMVAGVYVDREAAWDAFRDRPNLTLYVDEQGHLRGRPRSDEWHLARLWLHGHPMPVQPRRPGTQGRRGMSERCPDYVPDDISGQPAAKEGWIRIRCPACQGIVAARTGPDFWYPAKEGYIDARISPVCGCGVMIPRVTVDMVAEPGAWWMQ